LIPVTTFAGKKVAVFGLGSSGLLSARALAAGGAEVIAFDDDKKKLAEAQAAGLKTQDLHELDWRTIAALVLTPGVPLTHPAPHWSAALAVKAKVEIIGDIELFCRERAKSGAQSPLIAITGTNGKSTTTALIAHLLKSAGRDTQMGGNIGVPVLALEGFAHRRVYVLEVSSYQIDLAPSLHASVGILLNVTEDHLDRHGTMENYAAIKERLPANVAANGTAVIGVDDDWTRAAAERIARAGKHVERVSVLSALREGYYAQGSRIIHARNGKADIVADLAGIDSLRGAHNAQNAACAIATCLALGLELPVQDIRRYHRQLAIGLVLRQTPAARPRPQGLQAHQPFDPVQTAFDAVRQKVSPDTPRTVSPITGKEACPHLTADRFVTAGFVAGRAVQPGMEARPGHAHSIA